jgi:alanyl aminopeptidase
MSSLRFVLAFVLTACASAPSPREAARHDPHGPAQDPSPEPVEPTPGLRLPSDVRPLRYGLDLHVVPGAARVSGTVTIDLQLDRSRRVIWLNAEGLEVTAATLDGRPVRFESLPEGIAKVTSDLVIPAGPATLFVAYTAPIGHGGDAIFGVEEAGLDYTLTTFEPISARKAFPCFDEPGFKVPFDLTLTVPRGHVALANTPAVEVTPLDTVPATDRVRFARSGPLPTYLLSFAVGPFDLVDLQGGPLPATSARPALPIRGVALRGKGPRLAHQVAEAARFVLALEQWFGRPYPYAKLDLVAVPGFPGAMENAALISFDERLMMVDPVETSLARQRGAANTLAHELAHQWFGNLVTMAWWDDLWLNEAFATWIANVMVDAVRPELDAESRRLSEWKSAMATDARAAARRIRQPIASHHDIYSAFDLITYYKGSAVLAMFERWVGPTAWQAGVRAYLGAHADANATTDDLVSAISAAAGRDIGPAFRSFLDQPGAPLVTFSAKAAPDTRGSTLSIDVQRLRPLGSSAPASTWILPLLTEGLGLPRELQRLPLATSHAEVPVTGAIELFPNAGGRGYYQVQLSPAALLASALRSARDAGESAVLAQGILAAFHAGTLPVDQALGQFDALLASARGAPDSRPIDPRAAPGREGSVAHPDVAVGGVDPEVILAALELYRWVADRVDALGDDARARFERKARATFAPFAKRLGWKPRTAQEPIALQLLRADLLRFLIDDARDPATRIDAIARAKKLFVAVDGADDRVTGSRAHTPVRRFERGTLAPELVSLTLGAYVADGGRAAFDQVEAALFASTDPATRADLLDALGRARDSVPVFRLLGMVLDPRLTETELSGPLSDLLASPRTQRLALSWLELNFDAVLARLPPFEAGFLPGRLEAFCDAGTRAHLQDSFAARVASLPGGPQSLAESLESIDLCVALVEAQGPHLARWLAAPR